MRKTLEIPVCLIVLATAAALTGCESRRDCVDANGYKMSDQACTSGSSGAHYIYGGCGGRSVGDSVTGGSVTRGGFGSGGEGSGGEGGGGEAGGE